MLLMILVVRDKLSMHGSAMHGQELVDLRKESRWEFLNTSFWISEAVVYVKCGLGQSISCPDLVGSYSPPFSFKEISLWVLLLLYLDFPGAMLSELLTNWTIYTSKAVALFTLVINLSVGMLPHVDNFAHIGGFLTGLLVGWSAAIFLQTLVLNPKCIAYQYVFWVVAVVLVIVGGRRK